MESNPTDQLNYRVIDVKIEAVLTVEPEGEMQSAAETDAISEIRQIAGEAANPEPKSFTTT